MTPTPTQIATQAAEAILLPRSRTVHDDPDVDHQRRRDQLAALILSAAAKMVQQSGAVAAFEALLESGHETCDFAARCGLGDEETTKGARGALKLLRSISEGEGGPVIITPSKTPRILTEDELRRGIVIVEGGGSGGSPK